MQLSARVTNRDKWLQIDIVGVDAGWVDVGFNLKDYGNKFTDALAAKHNTNYQAINAALVSLTIAAPNREGGLGLTFARRENQYALNIHGNFVLDAILSKVTDKAENMPSHTRLNSFMNYLLAVCKVLGIENVYVESDTIRGRNISIKEPVCLTCEILELLSK